MTHFGSMDESIRASIAKNMRAPPPGMEGGPAPSEIDPYWRRSSQRLSKVDVEARRSRRMGAIEPPTARLRRARGRAGEGGLDGQGQSDLESAERKRDSWGDERRERAEGIAAQAGRPRAIWTADIAELEAHRAIDFAQPAAKAERSWRRPSAGLEAGAKADETGPRIGRLQGPRGDHRLRPWTTASAMQCGHGGPARTFDRERHAGGEGLHRLARQGGGGGSQRRPPGGAEEGGEGDLEAGGDSRRSRRPATIRRTRPATTGAGWRP